MLLFQPFPINAEVVLLSRLDRFVSGDETNVFDIHTVHFPVVDRGAAEQVRMYLTAELLTHLAQGPVAVVRDSRTRKIVEEFPYLFFVQVVDRPWIDKKRLDVTRMERGDFISGLAKPEQRAYNE